MACAIVTCVESSDAQRAEFGAVLAAQLEGWQRSAFAARVAEESGESVSENAVHLWLTGKSEPSRNKVWAMERVLELAPGTLSRCLGYLPVGARTTRSPEEAVTQDATLSADARRMLLGALRAARRG